MVSRVAQKFGVPIAFGMVSTDIVDLVKPKAECGIFPIRRFWRVPWILGLEKEG